MAQRDQRIAELFLDPHAGGMILDLLDIIDHDIDMARLHAVQIRRAINRRRRPLGVLYENNRVVIDDIPTTIPVPGPLRRQAASGDLNAFNGAGTADDPIDLS